MQCKIKTLTSKQGRQASIDLLECIAILQVIIYHSALYSSDILGESSLLHYLRYLFRTILSPCVPLFFFANGYLLFNKELNIKKHLYKIMHLIFLSEIWGFLKILILMPIKNEILSPIEVIKGLWSWKLGWINSLWFLGALVCIYVLFPILKVVYDNNKEVFYYFIIVCTIFTFGNALLNEGVTIFLTLILGKNITLQGINLFNIFNPFRGIYGYSFVYFCIGGCFYNIKDKILRIRPLKRNLIASFIMMISCLGLWGIGICYSKASNEMWDVVWNGYDTFFTFVNVICIYVLCLNIKKDLTFIRTISCNTLGIYFIHEIIIKLTHNFIKRYSFLCNIPFNIVYAIIIMMVCLIISLLMKRIPHIRRLVT